MNKAIFGKFAVSALIAGVLAASMSASVQARDRGINQPGAAGNAVAGPGGAGVDPGINQPGRAGNVGTPGAAGAAGAVGDPGVNQPGRAGNAGGTARDPGVNQPGTRGRR